MGGHWLWPFASEFLEIKTFSSVSGEKKVH